MIAAAEWKTGLRARRLFFFNAAVPAALAAAVAFSDSPRPHAALVYTILFTFFGVFGSAIPLVRDAESGLLGRVLLTGIAPARFVAERLAAQVALDAIQLAPALLLLGLAYRASPQELAAAALALAAGLLAANAIGVWVAVVARSIAEAALFGATVALLALHFAGVFRSPLPGSFSARVEPLLPFSALHDAVLALTGAATRPTLGAAAAAAGVIAVATAAFAAPLTRRLARPAD